MKLLAIAVVTLMTCGCLLDSVEPWLSPNSIVEAGVAVDGKWSVVDEIALFGGGSESVITLEHKPATERAKEFFYIRILTKERRTQFVFRATLHEIDDLRFLQVSNFTHFDEHIFGLANRPTYSLWRIEADVDNIMIWMPGLPRGRLKTLRDQDDKELFVDSASNNEAAIRDWVRAARSSSARSGPILALALTRTGTEFVPPAGAQQHLPEVRKAAKRARQKSLAEPSP